MEREMIDVPREDLEMMQSQLGIFICPSCKRSHCNTFCGQTLTYIHDKLTQMLKRKE